MKIAFILARHGSSGVDQQLHSPSPNRPPCSFWALGYSVFGDSGRNL